MTHVQISTPPSLADVNRIKALPNGGRGAIAVHGRASNRKARRQLLRELVRIGLDHRVAMTLGWSTSMPPAERDRTEPAQADASDDQGFPDVG